MEVAGQSQNGQSVTSARGRKSWQRFTLSGMNPQLTFGQLQSNIDCKAQWITLMSSEIAFYQREPNGKVAQNASQQPSLADMYGIMNTTFDLVS